MKLVDDSEIRVTVEDPHGAAATHLIKNLSAELGARYGDDGSGAFSPDDVQVPGGAFIVAWLDGRTVGCGALRPLERGVGEVKRMFVEKDARRQGVARKILERLETIAARLRLPSFAPRGRHPTAGGDWPVRVGWVPARPLLWPVRR